MTLPNTMRWAKRQIAASAKRFAKPIGYSEVNWLRVRQIERWQEFLATVPPRDMLEISPGWNGMWRNMPMRSYCSIEYPGFDICTQILDRTFDIVIADQVIEHVVDPLSAVANMRRMLVSGGYAMIAAPFLFRVHARPDDFCRWTEAGLRRLCLGAGFAEDEVTVESWGNRACARAHIGGPVRDYGFGRDMRNDPDYPMMVWAFARRGGEPVQERSAAPRPSSMRS